MVQIAEFRRIRSLVVSATRKILESEKRNANLIESVVSTILYIGITVPFLLPETIVYAYAALALYFAAKAKNLPVSFLSCVYAYLLLRAISRIPLVEDSLIELVISFERALGCDVPMSPEILLSGSLLVLICGGFLGKTMVAVVAVVSNIILFIVLLVSVQLYCRGNHISPSSFTMILVFIKIALELWNFCWFIRLRGNVVKLGRIAEIAASVFILIILLPAVGVFGRAMLDHDFESSGTSEHKNHVVFWWPEASREEELGFHNTNGHYGIDTIGFWGELPIMLERSGFITTKITSISAENLSKCRVFCMLSPPRHLSPSELSTLNQFIASGGSVFVNAEHTNLDDNMEILNPFLKSYGMSINFDTTNGLLGDGLKGVAVGNHPLRKHISESPFLVHNRGASLKLNGHQTFPVLTGIFWYGDMGNTLAPDRAYLGNYEISYGDQIGHLALMAIWEGGNGGKVFVSGDTSAFLNQNIGYGLRFITAVFDHLSSDNSFRPYCAKMLLLYIASISACVALLILLRRHGYIRVSLIIIGLMSIVGSLGIFESSLNGHPMPRPLAAVSSSENNILSSDPFSPFSPTGLLVTLTRQGFAPYFGDWERFEPAPDALFIVNPAKKLRKSQIEEIAKDGTAVVVSGGGDNEVFVRMADSFGIEVFGPPLGNVQGNLLNSYSAWEVRYADHARPAYLLKANDIAIGARLSFGRGSITFIADKGFFYSKNLETLSSFDLKNQAFIQELTVGGKPQ